jgi:hypothetical protein
MNFIKWYLKESWFHITWILGLLIYAITWYPGRDKVVAITFMSIVFIVLTLGKFKYWSKNIRQRKLD